MNRPGVQPAALDRAAGLLATEPGEAMRQAQGLLAAAPGDPRLLLILASAQRRLGDLPAALALLEPLARAFPKAALTQYEYGLILAGLGEPARGAEALRRATAANRDLAEAWQALGELLFKAGDLAGADAAFAEHGRAMVRDPRLKPLAEALLAGRLREAEAGLRVHLSAHPADAVALNMLADILMRQSVFADAEVLLAGALEVDPAFDGARFNYANALFQQQKAAAALPHLERLMAGDPRHAAFRNLMAASLAMVGDYDRAIALYEGLAADYPGQPRIWLNFGHTLRTVGRGAEAAAAYKRCIALAPGLGDAYWSLANLKTASFTGDEEAAMGAQLARPDLPADDRLHLHFALGKAMEDRADYAASFAHYAEGAAIRRSTLRYDADETTAQSRRSQALYTADFFAAREGAGSASDEPIFILGLPRSGSTLVEQILASHSAVEGTMELPDIGFVAEGLGWPGAGFHEAVAAQDPDALRALGDGYIESTRIQRKLGRRLFIDKMPNNFQHIGLIRLILPRARIVDARRHPLGACFSAFKQHFAQGQSFSYALDDLGRYYRDYVELLAHFDAVLPGAIHRAVYEDMVQDTEGEVRRLLAYCGLPFEDACLRFHENARAVRTVSSEQVRRPIFRDGLEQWRNYEPWLEPLKIALGPALERWRG